MSVIETLERTIPRPVAAKIGGRGSFARRVALMAGSTLAAQILGVAAAPLLTRLYTPEHFGLLAVLTSLAAPLTVAICARYEQAIPLPRSHAAAANVAVLSLATAAFLSGFVGVVAWWGRASIAAAFGAADLGPYLWLLPLSVLGLGSYTALTFWTMRKKAFARVAQTRMSQVGMRVGLQSLLGLLHVAPLGLLLGEALGQFGGSGTMAWAAWREDRKALGRVSWRRMFWAARRHVRFPLLVAPAAVLNILAMALPGFALPILFGTMQAGYFLVAQRLAGWPVTLLSGSVAQVFYTDLAARPDDHEGNWRRFRKLSLHLGLASLGGAVFLLTAPLWAAWVLGAEWGEAGWVMAAMTPMLVGRLLVSPVSHVYLVRSRQATLFWLDLLRVTLVLATFACCMGGQCGLRTTILFYSSTMCVMYMVHWVVIARAMANPACRVHSSELSAGRGETP